MAFLSRHPRAPSAILKALGVWVAVTLTAGLASVVLGLMLGFGTAGVFALRAEEWHRYSIRFTALAIATVYTILLLAAVPALGVFTAGLIPFAALGLGDAYADQKHRPAVADA